MLSGLRGDSGMSEHPIKESRGQAHDRWQPDGSITRQKSRSEWSVFVAGDIDRRHVPVHGQVGSVDRRGYPAGIGGGSPERRVG